MVVFAAPDTRLAVWVCFRKASDIDKQPITEIDPPRIDDIHAITTLTFPDPWVDIEEESAFHLPVVGCVRVVGLIVGLAKMVEGSAADLGIEIKVPWKPL